MSSQVGRLTEELNKSSLHDQDRPGSDHATTSEKSRGDRGESPTSNYATRDPA
jgi:hypothetical protein